MPDNTTPLQQETEQTNTDCRSRNGITVALIDTISFLLKQLHDRSLKSKEVQAALKDLQADEEVWSTAYKLIQSEKEIEFRKTVSDSIAHLQKDHPIHEYKKWLESQIERVKPLSVKAGQPKGFRQAYSQQLGTYQDCLSHLPLLEIKI